MTSLGPIRICTSRSVMATLRRAGPGVRADDYGYPSHASPNARSVVRRGASAGTAIDLRSWGRYASGMPDVARTSHDRSRTKDMMTAFEVEIPSLRVLGRHVLPRLVEGTMIPLALFVVGIHVLGVWGAMIAGLVWMYAAIFVRVALHRRVPGVLVLGAITLSARTVIALAAHSVLVYFLQPSLG